MASKCFPAGNDGTLKANGKTVGVVKDTTASSVLASSVDDATFKFFDSPGDALAAIKDGSVEFLGGNTLWLKANQAENAPDSALVPTLPYARSSIACVVADTTPKLLNISNLAIGRLLSSYINDDTEVRSAINQWIGKGSTVGLTDDQIGGFFTIVLSQPLNSLVILISSSSNFRIFDYEQDQSSQPRRRSGHECCPLRIRTGHRAQRS